MKSMRRLGVLVFILVMVAGLLTGCLESSDSKQREQQEVILKQATDKVGMPNIQNFFERETLKRILEMRDNPDLTTYAYKEQMNGRFIYIGRTVGYGIPYATQYTNPQKYIGTNGATLPQADPNALFSPDSAAATWVLLINEQTNEPSIMYFEPNLVITQDKLSRRLVEEWSLPPDY